jgi:Ca2+:H+ antiporter
MSLRWLLLVFIPIGVSLDWAGANPILVFLSSALAVAPLAGLMGDATEALAEDLGPTVGGLLNATLGNAPEIIIASFALHAGLVSMVKSSLAGSILGNLLFGLGISFFAGGIKHRRSQQFDPVVARINGALLVLASIGLIIPAVPQFSPLATREISRHIALVLFSVYVASLVATFLNRQPILGKAGVKAKLEERKERPDEVHERSKPGWSRNKSLAILAAVTIALAIMSEVLTGAIEPASKSLGLTTGFTGVILLALVGNAAELSSAVRFARQDQMDLAIGITVGASSQVGLLVAPVLVMVGILIGQKMDLVFPPLELTAIVVATLLARILIYDGESSWLEGLMLVAVYIMLGIGFFYVPEQPRAQPGIDPPGAAATP